jgi:sugar transferase EpsL
MYPAIKRVIDVSVALVVLVLMSPVMTVISLLLRVTQRKVLFRQKRPGLKGQLFTLLKFCTMNEARNASGDLLSDAERLTNLGRVLRKTSLDEFPQLWNVLRGDMSLVGPRPLLIEYLERYTVEQGRRHDVKPGITGWAQVHGRQNIPFSRRLVLDVWYVDHQSFWLDLKILLLTLPKMVQGSGVRSGQDVREVDDLGLHTVAHREGQQK